MAPVSVPHSLSPCAVLGPGLAGHRQEKDVIPTHTLPALPVHWGSHTQEVITATGDRRLWRCTSTEHLEGRDLGPKKEMLLVVVRPDLGRFVTEHR